MQSFWSVAQGHRFKRAFARRGDPAVFHTFLFLASSPSSQKKSRHPPSPSAAPLFPLTDSHRIIARRHLPVLGPRLLPWSMSQLSRPALAHRVSSLSSVHLLWTVTNQRQPQGRCCWRRSPGAGGHLHRQARMHTVIAMFGRLSPPADNRCAWSACWRARIHAASMQRAACSPLTFWACFWWQLGHG